MLYRLAAAAMLVGAVQPARATVVFSDGTFATNNWGFEQLLDGNEGDAVATFSASTGNPGSARRVNVSVGATAGWTMYAVNRYGTTQATRYDAPLRGAIDHVDFRIDARFVSGTFLGEGQRVYLAAKQGGSVYAAFVGVTGVSGTWTTLQRDGVRLADFQVLVGTSPLLDFGPNAQSIRFGFLAGNRSEGTAFSSIVDYDNFFVQVVSVPAPGCAGLALVAGLACVRRRR